MKQPWMRPPRPACLRRGALAAALSLLLTGCQADVLPYAREIDGLALMRTMGVDGGTEGVTVTVSSGVQSKGSDQGDASPVILSRQAGTISGALLSMQADGASYIFYGHVGQLLLGEGLARQSVAPALDYVLRDIEMRLDTQLYLVQGEAGAAISGVAGEATSAADRLDAMEEDAGLISHASPRTVGQVLSDLEGQGASYAPALRLSGQEEQTLDGVGYGVIKGGMLAAWAQGEAARGINLLEGQVDADIVELPLSGGGSCALRVVGARSTVEPVFRGETLTGLSLQCTVEANVAEAPAELDLERAGALADLEAALARTQEGRIRAALDLSQSLDADFLGLARRAGGRAPWHWATIQEQWDLPGLTISITVQTHIERGYDIDR